MDWLDKVFNYGVPTAVLLLIIYLLARGMKWIAPLLQNWFENSIDTQNALTKNTSRLTELLEVTTNTVADHEVTCRERSLLIHQDLGALKEAAIQACELVKQVAMQHGFDSGTITTIDDIKRKLEEA